MKADCLVTLGAGSLTDAAKVVSLALANDATTPKDLETLYEDSPTKRQVIEAATVAIICIPTSLSAGEYTSIVGATNEKTHHKHAFTHPSIGPRLVILDPELFQANAREGVVEYRVWAVDHYIEAPCFISANADSDKLAEKGLRRLLPGLLRTKEAPGDAEPRLQCQLGAADVIRPVLRGVPLGASHGIGHQLGPLGVGHGETSCVLLPALCKGNARANAAQ